jgi:predicted  nucleic acid-binding Zn-ribbon protein
LESRLRSLFALQFLDTKLDQMEELKGDLPGEIRGIEEKIKDLTTARTAQEQTMKNAFAQRDLADAEILGLKEKLERYKGHMTKVRNNREYDQLMKEMDNATERVMHLEQEMEALETKATVARGEIELLGGQIEELDKLLKEKQADLEVISASNEAEESRYREERKKMASKLAKGDLTTYERIRKAKRGKAVVPVERDACGGCFNRVPPQKILELKQNSRVYTCEHCGRILVSDEIVKSVVAGL